MDDESTDYVSDSVVDHVEIMRMNSKSSNRVMIDRNSPTNFSMATTANRKIGNSRDNFHRNKAHKFNFIELIENDREIPDFLNHSDDEDYNILNDTDSTIMWSRSTQTCETDTNDETKILHECKFNYPATIINCGSNKTHQVSISNQFYHELMLTRSQLNSAYHNYQTLKARFYKLHSDYQKLMGIAAELTTSLVNSRCGQPIDLRTTLQACKKIYPEIYDQNVRDDDKLKSLESESKIDYLDKNLKSSMLNAIPLSPKHLNYKKIKLHLINGNIRTKLLLLQALRWKITLSQPEERDETLNEYIRSDLLGLHGHIAGDSGKLILPYILIPLDVVASHPVQQSAARLLNTFASFKCGRDYLAVGPDILNVIIQCLESLHAESIDTFTCDMIIATLQKLSLRKQQRLYMISAGMIEWLIHHLKAECHSMGTYRLEYATALLMNLSLHKEAQIRAATIAALIVSTLIALLSSEHLPALPYVYGALNNFLNNTSINEEANIIGLKSILEYHRNYRTGELRRHLDHILLRYRRKFDHTIDEDINDDDDREEHDIVEDELDEMDPVKVHPGDLFGEGLLATCYSISSYTMPIDKIKFTSCSSLDVSYKTGDEFIAEREDERILKDRYMSVHSQKLTPRLTPFHYKSQFRNPARLNILKNSIVGQESSNNNKDITLNIEDKHKFTPEMSNTKNEIFANATSLIVFDQLYFANGSDQNYKEKVINSFHEFRSKDKEMLSTKSSQTEESKTNLWSLWDMSTNKVENFKQSKVFHSQQYLSHKLKTISESTSYFYENKKFKENSVTAVNSGMNESTTIIDSAFDGTAVVEERMGSIASLDINLNDGSNHQAVTELTGDEVDAFAAKPRISRTPP